jgi:predicted nucleic acid-binding protein
MILFIDSDILLDTILIRQPHFADSVAIVELADNTHFTLCTSVHGLLNIHYAAKKVFGEKRARQSVLVLTRKLKIVQEDVNTIITAANSNFPDFEDAVQYFAAISAKADAIITRNIKDYKQASIPVLTAEQFLKKL